MLRIVVCVEFSPDSVVVELNWDEVGLREGQGQDVPDNQTSCQRGKDHVAVREVS